jgi:hypothetical protein
MNRYYENEVQIEAVVHGFESCQTDKTNFGHSDHLTVAVWYLESLGTGEATDRMRSALRRFVDHHGVDRRKYHETMTVFWIKMVAVEVGRMSTKATLVEKCNQVIESLQDKNLVNKYYSKAILDSDEAREAFVVPDLQSW